jgi:hypothetical protein
MIIRKLKVGASQRAAAHTHAHAHVHMHTCSASLARPFWPSRPSSYATGSISLWGGHTLPAMCHDSSSSSGGGGGGSGSSQACGRFCCAHITLAALSVHCMPVAPGSGQSTPQVLCHTAGALNAKQTLLAKRKRRYALAHLCVVPDVL